MNGCRVFLAIAIPVLAASVLPAQRSAACSPWFKVEQGGAIPAGTRGTVVLIKWDTCGVLPPPIMGAVCRRDPSANDTILTTPIIDCFDEFENLGANRVVALYPDAFSLPRLYTAEQLDRPYKIHAWLILGFFSSKVVTPETLIFPAF